MSHLPPHVRQSRDSRIRDIDTMAIMPMVVKTGDARMAVASFTTTWDEAMALNRALRGLRRKLKETHNLDSLIVMQFAKPWGGPNRTEFSLMVELAKGTRKPNVAAVTKWLLDTGRDFVKDFRKKHRKPRKKKLRKKETINRILPPA